MTVRVETGKWARWRLVSAVSSRRLSSMAAATSPARCSRWIAANVTRVEPERDDPDVRCRAARPDEVIGKAPPRSRVWSDQLRRGPWRPEGPPMSVAHGTTPAPGCRERA